MTAEGRTATAATTNREATMKAIAQSEYGSPDVLEVREVERPVPGEGEVLVRVRAAAANPLDWHFMRGEPYFMRVQSGLRRPKVKVRGVDVAGVVEAVGAGVTTLAPDDEVFGWCQGAFAEYARAGADQFLPKPEGLTFEGAAAVPIAAFTALQGLRDEGELQAGQTVLINGASGGVGTFAVQIARSFGAAVTGVCSTRNLDLVRSLGADHVVDYTEEDFARSGKRYDVVFDLVGNRSLSDLRRVLDSEGTLVLSGGEGGPWLGPLGLMARAVVTNPFTGQRLGSFLASENREDLAALAELLEDGTITPVIDRTDTLAETAEAIRYLEEGHARGKVVITV
jgi:NADPH:quinone reductase-like Zn-dependent oxidoreductase